jgi:phage-related protein
MADKKQGIAIVRNEVYTKFIDAVFEAQRHPVDPEEDDHE